MFPLSLQVWNERVSGTNRGFYNLGFSPSPGDMSRPRQNGVKGHDRPAVCLFQAPPCEGIKVDVLRVVLAHLEGNFFNPKFPAILP